MIGCKHCIGLFLFLIWGVVAHAGNVPVARASAQELPVRAYWEGVPEHVFQGQRVACTLVVEHRADASLCDVSLDEDTWCRLTFCSEVRSADPPEKGWKRYERDVYVYPKESGNHELPGVAVTWTPRRAAWFPWGSTRTVRSAPCRTVVAPVSGYGSDVWVGGVQRGAMELDPPHRISGAATLRISLYGDVSTEGTQPIDVSCRGGRVVFSRMYDTSQAAVYEYVLQAMDDERVIIDDVSVPVFDTRMGTHTTCVVPGCYADVAFAHGSHSGHADDDIRAMNEVIREAERETKRQDVPALEEGHIMGAPSPVRAAEIPRGWYVLLLVVVSVVCGATSCVRAVRWVYARGAAWVRRWWMRRSLYRAARSGDIATYRSLYVSYVAACHAPWDRQKRAFLYELNTRYFAGEQTVTTQPGVMKRKMEYMIDAV